jgi:heptosyltransferase-2
MRSDGLVGVSRLLLRGLNWIGDAAMSLPTIWNVRESLPDARLAVLAPGWSSGLYEMCPAVNEVIKAPPTKSFTEIKTAELLARSRFDAALILPNSFRSALGPFLARIPHRWGYATDGRFPLLTAAVPLPQRAKQEHTVLYYRELIEAAGIDWRGERFDMDVSQDSINGAEKILLERGIEENRPRIGFSPGAAWGPSKRWPADRFSKTISLLAQRRGIAALVFGSAEEQELAEGIVSHVGEAAVNLAGAFPELRYMAAALSTCSLLITNDSGPMHIAAALGIPVVALFGPTDERRSGPWGLGEAGVVVARTPHCRPCYNPDCLEPGHPCMEDIAVDEVVEAAERLLDAGQGGASVR